MNFAITKGNHGGLYIKGYRELRPKLKLCVSEHLVCRNEQSGEAKRTVPATIDLNFQ